MSYLSVSPQHFEAHRSLEADASTTSHDEERLITLDQKGSLAQSYNQDERDDTMGLCSAKRLERNRGLLQESVGNFWLKEKIFF